VVVPVGAQRLPQIVQVKEESKQLPALSVQACERAVYRPSEAQKLTGRTGSTRKPPSSLRPAKRGSVGSLATFREDTVNGLENRCPKRLGGSSPSPSASNIGC